MSCARRPFDDARPLTHPIAWPTTDCSTRTTVHRRASGNEHPLDTIFPLTSNCVQVLAVCHARSALLSHITLVSSFERLSLLDTLDSFNL